MPYTYMNSPYAYRIWIGLACVLFACLLVFRSSTPTVSSCPTSCPSCPPCRCERKDPPGGVQTGTSCSCEKDPLGGVQLRSVGHCSVYDTFTSDLTGAGGMYCVPFSVTSSLRYPVCIYDPEEDSVISAEIYKSGSWQKHIMQQMMLALQWNSSLGFLDVGANIGMNGLAAAHLGRQVVLVEPVLDSARRIHAAANLGKVTHRITIVNNPVTRSRSQVRIKLRPDNMGMAQISHDVRSPYDQAHKPTSILLDDLTHVIPFKSAVMKVDIEAYEVPAFEHASELFSRLAIPAVFMEWAHIKHLERAQSLLDFFTSRQYVGYSQLPGYAASQDSTDTSNEQPLDWKDWRDWPGDVVLIQPDLVSRMKSSS